MDLTKSASLEVAKRRRAIADLSASGALKRHSLREIATALEQRGIVNPRTSKAWSHNTVRDDIEWLEAQWRTAAVREVSEHKAEILARYEHLYRLAISDDNPAEARHVLKGMRELLGTDAPQVIMFEQVEAKMIQALNTLDEEFADEPVVMARILGALLTCSC